MNGLLRTIATLGILILAVAGCGKGSQTDKAQSTNESGGAQAGSEAKEPAAAATGSTTEDKATPPPAGGDSGTLTEPDNGKTVDLHVGQIVTVVLDANHENGLQWALLESKDNVIAQAGAPAYVPAAPTMENGKETWHFRAVRPGEETVRLEYRRAMAQHLPERTFRFIATVH